MSETPAKFEGLLQRVRSAIILLPFVIAPVVFGGWSFTLLLAIAGFLMAREWGNLLDASPREGMALGVAVKLLLAFGLLVSPMDAIAVLVVGALAYAAYCLLDGRRLAPIVGGLYYIALPLIAAQFLRLDPLGMFVIGYILLSVWAVDIFAMFAGKLIGGPKLAPVISPKKTWAGLVGGMVGKARIALGRIRRHGRRGACRRAVISHRCRLWVWRHAIHGAYGYCAAPGDLRTSGRFVRVGH